jgi:hypothetical protein
MNELLPKYDDFSALPRHFGEECLDKKFDAGYLG